MKISNGEIVHGEIDENGKVTVYPKPRVSLPGYPLDRDSQLAALIKNMGRKMNLNIDEQIMRDLFSNR